MKLLALISVVVSSVSFASFDDAARCINRVVTAGCDLSFSDIVGAISNTKKCKQFQSGSGKTTVEAFLLESGKLITIPTEGNAKCRATKNNIDASGVEDIKIADNKLFMFSEDGDMFYMRADEQVYEVLSDSGKHYSSNGAKVENLTVQGDDVLIQGRNKKNELYTIVKLSEKKLDEKEHKGNVRKLSMERRNLSKSWSIFAW